MLLAFADAPVPGKRLQKGFVHLPIERRQLQPFLQVPEQLELWRALDELLQQGGATPAEPSPLRSTPAVEDRVAVDLQAFQEISREKR
jgi:hypothetical protein